ncbi:hypothetical protein CWE21_10330 [Pseudidiomarina aquimaris]|uniref:Uncharacterized protein n=1 Tax=Pseudidiomarina aquimaris TaxID=641841 RepID=A0A432XCS0_9GAMM|nr:hypothetical protein CWE21_10330 [Pseudidiomarina aquimaris]
MFVVRKEKGLNKHRIANNDLVQKSIEWLGQIINLDYGLMVPSAAITEGIAIQKTLFVVRYSLFVIRSPWFYHGEPRTRRKWSKWQV